jgi:hypothetical protein
MVHSVQLRRSKSFCILVTTITSTDFSVNSRIGLRDVMSPRDVMSEVA